VREKSRECHSKQSYDQLLLNPLETRSASRTGRLVGHDMRSPGN
jgi:hypothetical protein